MKTYNLELTEAHLKYLIMLLDADKDALATNDYVAPLCMPTLRMLKQVQSQEILNGEKTIEVRKSLPKCDYPIDVYIYCTKSMLCTKDGWNLKLLDDKLNGYDPRGKVIAKFTLNKIDIVSVDMNASVEYFNHDSLLPTCLTIQELRDYSKGKTLYFWNIEDLVIFDKPMELGAFKQQVTNKYYKNKCLTCRKKKTVGCLNDATDCNECLSLTRPPQSWQYVYFGGVD